jgi:hypothetical protein
MDGLTIESGNQIIYIVFVMFHDNEILKKSTKTCQGIQLHRQCFHPHYLHMLV